MAPTAHIFMEDLEEPYVGYVTARPYSYVGEDARLAIRGLGDLPAALMANRLLVVWEERDLAISLGMDFDTDEMALNAVEATFDSHTLYRTPFKLTVRGSGVSCVNWGTEYESREANLPPEIFSVIETWRFLNPELDLRATVAGMRADGYSIVFVSR